MVSRAPIASAERTAAARPRWPLVAWMLLAIAVVTGLAWWAEQREADAALRDLQTEQSIIASSLAAGLRARLATLRGEAALVGERGSAVLAERYSPIGVRSAAAPRPTTRDPQRLVLNVPLPDGRIVDFGLRVGDLVGVGAGIDRQNDTLVLLQTPYETELRAADGRVLRSTSLLDALDRGATGLRLAREQAAEVGLPARTSVAGVARVEAGDLGRWGVVVVASAAAERDREKRSQRRLILSVLVASGLVLAFGGEALRRQRKELELQRELAVAEVRHQRDDRLLHAERVATMGTFAMGIAHEVSTPLGIIVGRAEQLTSGVSDPERAQRNVQAILKQAGRIQQIVRRFLDMARGGPPSLARTDPAVIVRAAANAVEHRYAKAKVALGVDVPATMPAIQCDRDLLEQAIVNLLLNACEACTAGGHVEIAARADAEQVAFVVSDNGAGISPEDAARAAEPFFTTKDAGSGSGLGLAIATEIVKSHRGDLTIVPKEGHGTRARIEIPIAAGGSNGHQ